MLNSFCVLEVILHWLSLHILSTLYLCLTEYHAMETYPTLNQAQYHEGVWESASVAPYILNLGTRRRIFSAPEIFSSKSTSLFNPGSVLGRFHSVIFSHHLLQVFALMLCPSLLMCNLMYVNIIHPEDGSSKVLQNAGIQLYHYMMQQPRRPQLTSSLLSCDMSVCSMLTYICSLQEKTNAVRALAQQHHEREQQQSLRQPTPPTPVELNKPAACHPRDASGSVSPGMPTATLDLSSVTTATSPHELSTLVWQV
jgi:hypothetical protein